MAPIIAAGAPVPIIAAGMPAGVVPGAPPGAAPPELGVVLAPLLGAAGVDVDGCVEGVAVDVAGFVVGALAVAPDPALAGVVVVVVAVFAVLVDPSCPTSDSPPQALATTQASHTGQAATHRCELRLVRRSQVAATPKLWGVRSRIAPPPRVLD
jgi:hypothetical protein